MKLRSNYVQHARNMKLKDQRSSRVAKSVVHANPVARVGIGRFIALTIDNGNSTHSWREDRCRQRIHS